jgi:hypothetical protein
MRAAQDAAARLHAVTGHADHVIGTVLVDAGYNSDANLNTHGRDRLIATGLTAGGRPHRALPTRPSVSPIGAAESLVGSLSRHRPRS